MPLIVHLQHLEHEVGSAPRSGGDAAGGGESSGGAESAGANTEGGGVGEAR